jgi:23S rRNA (uracil1939-C5)-methyltransferase
VKQLAGVELSESACNDFALNLDAHDNVSLYVGKVEEVVTSLELKPDLVILDPPRAGLDRRVVEYLKKVKPQQVIYVSCDPSTLARDCKRLIEGGFTVESIQPFDLFPHTYHVECVVMLSEKFDSES